MRSGRGKVEGGGLLVLVVICAMVCERGVRLDGEALASPLSLICAGEAPASASGGAATATAMMARGDALAGERRAPCTGLPFPRSLAEACRPCACVCRCPTEAAGRVHHYLFTPHH